MSGIGKHGAKTIVGKGCKREMMSTHTLDDSGLKKEMEQGIARMESMVKVANSSTTDRLTSMEVAMGKMVTEVTRMLESCLEGQMTTHEDLKELDVAKGASGKVDLDVEVLTADQGNDKAAESLGALEQLQSKDEPKIARLWAEGDGHIGMNLPLLLYLRKKQVEPTSDSGQSVD